MNGPGSNHRDEEMKKLGDKLVASHEHLAEQIVEAGQVSDDIAQANARRANDLQELAQSVAETAALATAKATEGIRKLTVITVLLGSATLVYLLVFSMMFWKYAIVLRTP